MNRETKRMMERRGRGSSDGAGGSSAATDDEVDAEELAAFAASRPGVPNRTNVPRRTTPLQFAREIRDELRQVAWPTRAEMVNYSLVVFFTLVLMIVLIFLLNLAFGKGVFFMFQK